MNDIRTRPARGPSAGFLHALFGLGLTVFSWYSPWVWPALPALAALDVIGGQTELLELNQNLRGAIVVVLIVINAGFWAAVSWLLLLGIRRFRS